MTSLTQLAVGAGCLYVTSHILYEKCLTYIICIYTIICTYSELDQLIYKVVLGQLSQKMKGEATRSLEA